MAFGSENVKVAELVIDVNPPGGDGDLFHLVKAARDLTVIGFHVASRQANNAGTAIQAALLKYDTSGGTLLGTVVANVGGTTVGARLAALVPGAGSVDNTQAFVAVNQWVAVRFGAQGAGWQSGDRLSIILQYLDGKAV